MDVVDDQDHRPRPGDVLEELADGPRGVLDRARIRPPEQAADKPRDPVAVLHAGHQRRQLRDRRGRVIGVDDPRRLSDDLADRVEGDAIAVRETAAAEDRRVLDAVEELADEARLPDAGRPEQREQVRGPLGPRAIQPAPNEVELRGTSDHRGVEVTGMSGDVGEHGPQAVGLDGHRLPSKSERLDRLDVDRIADQPLGRGRDEGLARLCRLFEPGGHVDRVARDEALTGRRIAGNDLAGVHTDADGDPEPVVALEPLVQVRDGGVHRRSRPHRTKGVVLMELRDAEDGHDGIADVLLDGPTVRFDRGSQRVEVAGLYAAQGFRVEPLPDASRIRPCRRRRW